MAVAADRPSASPVPASPGSLPDQFAQVRDIPAEEETDQAGRHLPDAVMRTLKANLAWSGTSTLGPCAAVELELWTPAGAPDGLELPWDCLAQDPDGKDVLVYFN